MIPPEVARFVRVVPEPGGPPCVLVALEADAVALLGEVPALGTFAGLLAPWALVAWLRPEVLAPLLGAEHAAALAVPPPGGRWVLVALDGAITRHVLAV